MKVAIHQPHYLPWLGYFAKWAAANRFIFLDTVQYEKNGWQNRNRIKTAGGPRWLTVPVHAHLGTPIRDLTIDTTQQWRERHRRVIEQAYATAPHLERDPDALVAFYRQDWDRLAPLAVASSRWLAEALGVVTPVVLASELGVEEGGPADDATARLGAFCRGGGAGTGLAGEYGARYPDTGPVAAGGVAGGGEGYRDP